MVKHLGLKKLLLFLFLNSLGLFLLSLPLFLSSGLFLLGWFSETLEEVIGQQNILLALLLLSLGGHLSLRLLLPKDP